MKVVLLCSSHTVSVSPAFTSFWMGRAACRTPVDLIPATDRPTAPRWDRGRWGESLSCVNASSPVKAAASTCCSAPSGARACRVTWGTVTSATGTSCSASTS